MAVTHSVSAATQTWAVQCEVLAIGLLAGGGMISSYLLKLNILLKTNKREIKWDLGYLKYLKK